MNSILDTKDLKSVTEPCNAFPIKRRLSIDVMRIKGWETESCVIC